MADGLTLASFGAAFGAGIISVLSPCVMPLMPAYLSLISGISVEEMQGEAPDAGLRRRVLLGCAGFVAGFSTVFILLGASATAIGHVLNTWRLEVGGVEITAVQVAGVVIILMGVHLMGLLPIQALYRDTRFNNSFKPKSWIGTYLVGAAFAFGWSPCIGPILGGILTIAGARDTVWQGMALLAVYSLGLGVPFFLAGWSIEFFFKALQRMKAHFRRIEIASGALLVALGLLVVTRRLTLLNEYFSFLNSFVETIEGWLL
ncbi:MAG: cytochrome c biogenesis protein CcdA [Deltaproteobacteria bacterium]|nr:cytochrome c biogenesis protein CcdA [Deltaproteobacteria bacterium]MBW2394227.1 cytochrome c biogenesis protein CcdA [Deltaproteobacteria bacterium]